MDKWTVAVLGDGGVGKTALAVRVSCYKLVPFTYNPTIEDSYRKQFSVDDLPCSVELIDTAGQEEYAILRDQWVRAGDGFILVYSISARSSFQRIETYYQSVLRAKGTTKLCLLLAGNKCDMPDSQREVEQVEGIALARKFGCPFVETSAKTGINVDAVFSELVRALRVAKPVEAAVPTGSLNSKKSQRNLKDKKCIVM
ncbi:P-loop containing nucleoside triphosphate hydrolase protein [Favolaschia claudopus]|uniref:P-loop containing nucleoside triphosphate hydrolase protein n=1 Tax=Favolaschia claudopus TaxID=2862362 RepID=A0AAW0CKB3_9AGAR